MKAKAVGYSRESTHDQSRNSTQDQHVRIGEYCDRNNLELVAMFTEKGRSGFTFNRPEWRNLEAYLKKNKDVKFIIIKHIDRFSRADLLDALMKLDEIENKLKVKVVSIEDPINQNSSDLGVQLMRTIKLIFSADELNRIKDRVSDGIYRSHSNGRYCHSAPEGYINSRDNEGKPLLKIDEPRAAVIRKIFQWYRKGKNIVEILKLAREAGLKRKGKSVIQEILANPLYAGLLRVKPYKGNPGKIVKGLHAPIISEQTFWAVQERLQSKRKKTHSNEEVPLKGAVRCVCGHKMTAGNSRGRNGTYYWYLICWNDSCKYFKKHNSATKMTDMLGDILDVLSFEESKIELYRSLMIESIEKKYANKGGSIMKAKLELQKVQQKINATQEKYLLQPDISAEVYAKVITGLKVQESAIQAELAKLSTDVQVYYDAVDRVLPKLKNIRARFFTWPLHLQHVFLNRVFRETLMFNEGIYRTGFIDPIFADKVLILKEKGLLIVEQSLKKSDASPFSGVDRARTGVQTYLP